MSGTSQRAHGLKTRQLHGAGSCCPLPEGATIGTSLHPFPPRPPRLHAPRPRPHSSTMSPILTHNHHHRPLPSRPLRRQGPGARPAPPCCPPAPPRPATPAPAPCPPPAGNNAPAILLSLATPSPNNPSCSPPPTSLQCLQHCTRRRLRSGSRASTSSMESLMHSCGGWGGRSKARGQGAGMTHGLFHSSAPQAQIPSLRAPASCTRPGGLASGATHCPTRHPAATQPPTHPPTRPPTHLAHLRDLQLAYARAGQRQRRQPRHTELRAVLQVEAGQAGQAGQVLEGGGARGRW